MPPTHGIPAGNRLARQAPGRQPARPIVIAGRDILADASGALFLETERALVVADLHFEKGSSYAARGVLLPPYDTAATLARLALAIAFYRPKMVLALGDSFHDRGGAGRMVAIDVDALRALQAGRDWVWIAGNHDPKPPANLGGLACGDFRLAGLTFRHEPKPGAGTGEIAGHLHPCARIRSTAGSTRRRCFVSDGTRCVMPAFGAYAGGLNICDEAFDPLFGSHPVSVHALGRDRVWQVPFGHCAAD